MAGHIIGLGGDQDPRAIPLVTCKGWRIPNVRRPLPRTPEIQKAAVQMHQSEHPSLRVRSLSADYNCVGLVFAARRTFVDIEHLNRILADDNYRPVAEKDVFIGDIVTYRDSEGDFAHVGVVMERTADIQNATFRFKILSQWGLNGEYVHDHSDVRSDWLQGTMQFWMERVT